MYAVIRAGGKQYRVAPGDVIRVETQEDKDGKVEFGDVLAVSAEAGSVLPPGAGALVSGEVVDVYKRQHGETARGRNGRDVEALLLEHEQAARSTREGESMTMRCV